MKVCKLSLIPPTLIVESSKEKKMRLLIAMQRRNWGFPAGSVVKNLPAKCQSCGRHGFNLQVREIPWRK